jgi:anthranilate phosphoribosyltransferase
MDASISRLREGKHLGEHEIREACEWLLDEKVPVEQRAEFLRLLHEKGEAADEIAFFADELMTHAVPFPLDPASLDGPLIDVCGTGGDGKHYFNVSTCVMFVTAACGAKVAKHGNRSITSQCGGADVLEALGVKINRTPADAVECLKRSGAVFLFAPEYHPAFKAVAPVRKALAEKKQRSIFNILGPLLNPARPDFQLAGIFSASLLEIYAKSLIRLGRRRAWAVSGGGGEDEISMTDPTEIVEAIGESSRRFSLSPEDVSLKKCESEILLGGNAAQNAGIVEDILGGKITDGRRDIVVLNTAAALVVAEIAKDVRSGITLATEAIAKGEAREVLKRMRE